MEKDMNSKPRYSTQVINNRVQWGLSEGFKTEEICDTYLMMRMANDLEGTPSGKKSVSFSDIDIHMMGNGVISDKDYGLRTLLRHTLVHCFTVSLTPTCTIYIKRVQDVLEAFVNEKPMASVRLYGQSAESIVEWLIKQKQKIDGYMADWEQAMMQAAKKNKRNRMAMLAIKAIVSEQMKEYPDIRYDFFEQKRRLRIRVKMPNSKLCVNIDAWLASYKKRLPEQMTDLKVLIEAHSKVKLTDFILTTRL